MTTVTAPKDAPIVINNNITNYGAKPEEKKSEPSYKPGMCFYYAVEGLIHVGMATRYPEEYATALVAGASYGLYRASQRKEDLPFDLQFRATTFAKENSAQRLWIIAEEVGLKAITALNIAERLRFTTKLTGGSFVSAAWAFSFGSDVAREIYKTLTFKKV